MKPLTRTSLFRPSFALGSASLLTLYALAGCSSAEAPSADAESLGSGRGAGTGTMSSGDSLSGSGASSGDPFLSGGDSVDTDGDFGDSSGIGEEASGKASSSDDEGQGAGGAGGAAPDDEVPEAVDPPEPKDVPDGQLTAGMFDDNLSYSFFERYQDVLLTRQLEGMPQFELQEQEAAHDQFSTDPDGAERLDITLVVDTTGSMGDELGYLQREFSDLTATISERYPNAEQRWALVLYRDEGDDYLTRVTEFESSVESFQSTLAAARFGGGGDYPEAPDAGLKEANGLAWRDGGDVARLVFWVADAPHHGEKAGDLVEAVETARDQDIAIYPVASSGVDELTEYTMRASAQLTGGRYIFLTDDSGLGGAHKEPTLPCYFVTTLTDAILRAVDTEMSGEHELPDEEEVIRLGGRLNTEGNCYFGDGYMAKPF